MRPEDPNIQLVDFKQKFDELKPDITCLWTEPFLIGEASDANQTISGRKLILNGGRHCPRETLGNHLVWRKADEKLLIRCNPVTYGRLLSLDLDCIEGFVWPEVLQEVTTESSAKKVADYLEVIARGVSVLADLNEMANGEDGGSSDVISNTFSNTIGNNVNSNVRVR